MANRTLFGFSGTINVPPGLLRITFRSLVPYAPDQATAAGPGRAILLRPRLATAARHADGVPPCRRRRAWPPTHWRDVAYFGASEVVRIGA